jgi:cellulose biosynthesis protein BcsQ
MKIMTVSGFKGGTGKTTLSALLGVAAMTDGARVAMLDLDRNTRNLTSFLDIRRRARLPAPDLVTLMEFGAAAKQGVSGRLEPLMRLARLDGYDLLVIDTSSGHHQDLYEAHLLADVIVTPMNESPADLHGLFARSGERSAPTVNYRDLIDACRFDRRRARLPVQQWHVVLNRLTSLPTRVGVSIQEKIERLRADAGYDALWRVRDRIAHRAIAHEGLTVFDAPPGGKLSMSEIAGRTEIRALLGAVAVAAGERRLAA